MLVEPRTLAPLTQTEGGYSTATGVRYELEDGVVRLLRHVDPALALELEAQARAVDEYSDPTLLMPRYEPDMARLALIDFFEGRPPSGKILDAGCGIGLLGRMFPDLGLVGVDASFPLLQRATTGYSLRVEVSAEALPFPDASFDAVIALNMLHHVITPRAAVAEFARVLRPGGVLVAVDPRKVLAIELAKRLIRGNDPAFAPSHKAFGVDEYDALLEQDGLFRLEQRRRVGLVTLITMAGFDTLRWSRRLKDPARAAELLMEADRLLFRLPFVAKAGLNLAVRAVRTATPA